MIPSDSPVSLFWQPEETTPDLTRAAPLHGFLLPNSLVSGIHPAGTIPDPPPISQVVFDPAGAQDHYSAFLEWNSSLGSNGSDAVLAPIDVTRGHTTWVSSGPECGMDSALTENPATNNTLQASDEVIWYSVTSAFGPLQIPCTTSPKLQALSLGEDIEESLRTTADPLSYPPTVMDIPPTDWATGHPETGLSPRSPFTFDFVDAPFWTEGSSFPGENSQMVGTEAVQSPLYTSTLTLEDLGWPCWWINEDGTLCDEVVTCGGLPMHLAKHGIKNKTRNSPIKCRWLGCKTTKSMNRENIVRHTREVHMHLRRPSKRG